MKNPRTLFALALAATIAGPELHAQEAAPPTPTSGLEPSCLPNAASAVDVRLTRLFVAPTARSLPRGRGSVGLTEVVFPSVEVGLSNRVSVWTFGVLPAEGLSDGGIEVAPKIQLLSGTHVQAAVGASLAVGSGGTWPGVYGVVTLGSADTAVTVGYMYDYVAGMNSEQGSSGTFFFGAEKAIGRSLRLIGEGDIIIGDSVNSFLVGGARFTRGRWSVDLGVLFGSEVFPFLTIAWAF
jgi:hypothetical protein